MAATMTTAQRITKVVEASDGLAGKIADAILATTEHGPDSDQAKASWETVEACSATLHRQSRRLAGKARGG